MRPATFAAILALAATHALGQVTSIVNSPHNLSASGKGKVHASSEQEICIFCHTPHNALPIEPLWNRNLPVSAYQVYSSNSLKALPSQPTGSSKKCLSCHDGTIALGSVYSRGQTIMMSGGVTTLPPGTKNLGTDLRDDHPISFRYDSTLVTKNGKLKDPTGLPTFVRLDKNHEVQCTTCHDPHNNSKTHFLVMENTASQLCNSCHVQGVTTVANHVNCNSCHQSHSAPSGPYLLKQAKTTDTCLACHSGGNKPPQGSNVAADVKKFSTHDTSSAINLADPYPNNVTCTDCHEPHTMDTTAVVAPNVPSNYGKVSGVTTGGATLKVARYEYEVCFKCHGNKAAVQPRIPRQIVQNDLRLKFDPTAISFHPVEMAGKNTTVPSLRPGLTTTSMIYCSDCHNSDTGRKAGSSGPNGVHGSGIAGLLARRYETADSTSESATAYALCYGCHDRNILLSDQSAFKRHKLHVVDERAPCSACHDPHGISSAQGSTTKNSRLMNFDTRIVFKNFAGRLEYNSTGSRRGNCYLKCHNRTHSPESYGP
jgi:predicted CXXCH cytochrome family protein